MEGIPHPHYDDGARKNNGWAIPSPCRALWRRCVVSIAYTICFIALEASIWRLCLWISVLTWTTTTNWFMILWKIVTTWKIWRWWILKMSFPNWHELACPNRVSERRSGRTSSAPRRTAMMRRSSEVWLFKRTPVNKCSFEDKTEKRQHVSLVRCLWMCVPLGNVFSQSPPGCSRHSHQKVEENFIGYYE